MVPQLYKIEFLSSLTLCNPMVWPWNSLGKITGLGCHYLTPGDLPVSGINPRSHALQADSLPSELPGKPVRSHSCLLFPYFLCQYWFRKGKHCDSVGKESACNVGDLGSIPGLGRSPGEGKGYQLQYSGLENSMDCTVHGVTESWTQLSGFHFQSFSNK